MAMTIFIVCAVFLVGIFIGYANGKQVGRELEAERYERKLDALRPLVIRQRAEEAVRRHAAPTRFPVGDPGHIPSIDGY